MKFPTALSCLFALTHAHAATFLVEAERFSEKGGWGIDTQFIESMGSPYLIAHGLGKPLADATTKVSVPEDGDYRVWVRTIDWTKRLDRPASAGLFKVTVNGQPVGGELGGGGHIHQACAVVIVEMKACGIGEPAGLERVAFHGGTDEDFLHIAPSEVWVFLEHHGDPSGDGRA